MNKQEKKYLEKRDRIARVIIGITVHADDWRGEVHTRSNPSDEDAIDAAEKILSKFGINKPNSLKNVRYGIRTYRNIRTH